MVAEALDCCCPPLRAAVTGRTTGGAGRSRRCRPLLPRRPRTGPPRRPGPTSRCPTDTRSRSATALERVLAIAGKAERQATRWADPLPVPEWVAQVRAAIAEELSA